MTPVASLQKNPASKQASGLARQARKGKRAPAVCAAEPEDPDTALFRRGKQVLGRNAGGQIAKLKRAKGSIALARAAIETASTKDNPAEYVAACIRQKNGADYDPDDMWANGGDNPSAWPSGIPGVV